MGGLGSGRHWPRSSHGTVEGCPSIDVREWRRKGLLPTLCPFTCTWSRAGTVTASADVEARDGRFVVLRYRVHAHGTGEGQETEQRIPIEWTPCHFGGERPWFVCAVSKNGEYCGRRVAKLYGAGTLFACRHCYELSYQSQRETPDGRATLKAQRIRKKLGGSPSLFDDFPIKPKGMHWRTYRRMCETAYPAELQALNVAVQWFGGSCGSNPGVSQPGREL